VSTSDASVSFPLGRARALPTFFFFCLNFALVPRITPEPRKLAVAFLTSPPPPSSWPLLFPRAPLSIKACLHLRLLPEPFGGILSPLGIDVSFEDATSLSLLYVYSQVLFTFHRVDARGSCPASRSPIPKRSSRSPSAELNSLRVSFFSVIPPITRRKSSWFHGMNPSLFRDKVHLSTGPHTSCPTSFLILLLLPDASRPVFSLGR